MSKRMQFVVWALCAVALTGCYSTMSGSNAGGSFNFAGRGGAPLVDAAAHATSVTADSNAYATVADANGRTLHSAADYNRAMSLTDLQSACNARLALASQAGKEEKYRCRRIQDQQYNLEVLNQYGVWNPVYGFGAGSLGMFGGAATIANLQNGGTSGNVRRELETVKADVAATRNRQRAVEAAVGGLNQDVYDATGK